MRTWSFTLLLAGALAAGCNQSSMSPISPSTSQIGGGGTNWETGTFGCTPGYWKQSQHFDSWPDDFTGEDAKFNLTPETDFNDAFDLGPNSPWVNPGELTMLQALELEGGGMNALFRHMAAALLNATVEIYPIDLEDLRARVFELHASSATAAEIEAFKNLLERNNERRCPLN